ncbi:MAG: P-type conjugative transfer protein TrbL, partial [Comamonas sp.]
RMVPAAAKLAGSGARAATSTASSARSAFQAGSASAGGGLKGAAAGAGNVAKTGAQAAGQKVADGARSMKARVAAAFRPDDPGSASGAGATQAANEPTSSTAQPAWARRLHRRQQLTHAATTAAHTLRGGDGGTSSQGPSLRDDG